MVRNRSAPPFAVMPVLSYPDVAAAVEWLSRAFGLVEHVRVGEHRAQVGFADGALFVADTSNGRTSPGSDLSHSVMVRVPDVDQHFRVAVAAGAQVLAEPTDQFYGERQYTAVDLAGHRWTFTQSVADVAPEEWGGTTVVPW